MNANKIFLLILIISLVVSFSVINKYSLELEKQPTIIINHNYYYDSNITKNNISTKYNKSQQERIDESATNNSPITDNNNNFFKAILLTIIRSITETITDKFFEFIKKLFKK